MGWSEKGVVVGCDQNQQWLLPWWWSCYSRTNAFPVTFVDFGMSVEAAKWCEKRGQRVLLEIPKSFIAAKEDILNEHRELWESVYEKRIWEFRTGWFKKPLAMLRSPYRHTLWLDMDCEVIRPLDPLFAALCENGGIALVEEPEHIQRQSQQQNLLLPGETLYNSGVVLFEKGSSLILHWAQKTLLENAQFMSDQNVLSRLIFQNQKAVKTLSPIYNWRIFANSSASSVVVHPEAAIIHWACAWGKDYIRRFGGLNGSFDGFPRSDF